MATIPRFLQPASFGETVPAATLDFTEAMVEMAHGHAHRFKAILGGDLPRVIELQNALGEAQRDAAFSGKLALPGFFENLKAFAAAIGLPENARCAAQHMSDIRRARWNVESAERLLKSTRDGRITTDAADMGMIRIPDTDIYHREIEEAYEDWGYDDYVAIDPAPHYESPEYEAWSKRYGVWVQANACPFVHGTRQIILKRLTAAALLESYAEHESDNLIDSYEHWLEWQLDDHHEDAGDDIKGESDFLKALHAWEVKKRGADGRLPKGIQSDDELEAILKSFNDQQTLVSFAEVPGLLVTLKDETTHADCIAWAERNAQAARQALAKIEQSFEPPVAV